MNQAETLLEIKDLCVEFKTMAGTDPAAGLVHCEHPLGGCGLRCIGRLDLQLL